MRLSVKRGAETAARIPLLPRPAITQLLSELIDAPVTPELVPLVVDALKALDAPLDRVALSSLFLHGGGMRNVRPDILFALPAALRQAIWRIAPRQRFEMDIRYLLQSYDADVATWSKPLNLMLQLREGRDATARRRKLVVQTLLASVRGDGVLYAWAADVLLDLFLATRDAKWATLRVDLFVGLQDGGRLPAAGAVAPPAPPPRDPLGLVLNEVDRLGNLLSGASFDALLHAVRCTVTVRNQVDLATVQETARTLLKQAHDRANKSQLGKAFLTPVIKQSPALAPAYLAKVAHPIDIGTMVSKARDKKYATLEEVHADMALMVENCRTFNGPPADVLPGVYTKEAESLLAAFDAEYRQTLSKLGAAAGGSASGAVVPAPAAGFESSRAYAQLAMVLADPYVTRSCVQAVLRGLVSASKDGRPAAQDPAMQAPLLLLAVGDLAYTAGAPPAATASSSSAPTGAGGASQHDAVSASGASMQALYELVGAGPDSTGFAPPPPAPPLPVRVACAALQNLLMAWSISTTGAAPTAAGGFTAATSPSAAAGGDSAVAQPSGSSTSENGTEVADVEPHAQAALRTLLLLRRGQHTYGRSASALVVGYAAYAAYNAAGIVPLHASHLERLFTVAQAATGADGVPDPSLVPTLLYVLARYLLPKPLAHLRQPPPRPVEPTLEPPAVLTALVEKWLLPLLDAVRDVPSVRCLIHDQLARFLKFACEKSVLQPAAAETYVVRAIASLTPTGAPLDAALAAAPDLRRLLGSILTPVALVWSRPDFEAARASYMRLILSHLRGFDWATAVGLVPPVMGVALPGPTPSPGAGTTPFTPFAVTTPLTPATPADAMTADSGTDDGSTGGGL